MNYKTHVPQLLVLLDGLYVMLLNIFSLNMECFPILGETTRAAMIPALFKFMGMFMTAGINKVTIYVVMMTSTLFVPVWYLLPVVTLNMLNSQSLISTLFLQQFLLQQYLFHGMHAVIVPLVIAMRRDETNGRLDK